MKVYLLWREADPYRGEERDQLLEVCGCLQVAEDELEHQLRSGAALGTLSIEVREIKT